jgi:hypothetical protein
MALTIRLDPWGTDYDGGLQLPEEDEAHPATVDPTVETEVWEPILPNDAPRPEAIVFVDGVQRTEAKLVCSSDEGYSYGALASIGVGATFVEAGRARMVTQTPIRTMALTGGEIAEEMAVPCGQNVLRFKLRSQPDSGPQAVIDAINETRGEAEGRLATELSEEGYPMVIVDGRLSFQPQRRGSMVVGLVKSIQQQYLPMPQRAVLGQLSPGSRTPIFLIDRATPLYSWYVRLAPLRPIEHVWAGLVRLETVGTMEIEAAQELADTTARWLPTFASTPAWDARAPQNLFPICALEQRLHHELGDRAWVRSAIECAMAQAAAPQAAAQ